jgi:hypothetical protein
MIGSEVGVVEVPSGYQNRRGAGRAARDSRQNQYGTEGDEPAMHRERPPREADGTVENGEAHVAEGRMADGQATRHRHAVNDATEMSQGKTHDQASEKSQSEPVSRMAPASHSGIGLTSI